MATAVKKVVLAYSGGLDTSIILKWLQETYACEVVTFTADLGQGEELAPARNKAEMLGIKEIFVDEGPTMKRIQPRAQGRANQILKRSSHITVVVATPVKEGAR